jgi:hypothetical protein
MYDVADVDEDPYNISTAVHAGAVTPVVSLPQLNVIV